MRLRLSLVMAVALLVIVSMNSCVHKYICHCDISYSGLPGLPDTVRQEYNITDSKTEAESKCKANSGTYDNNGIHTIEDCYLY